MKKPDFIVIDFDSTFVAVEGLDTLAAMSLKKRKDRELLVRRIEKVTTLAMEGKISFSKALAERLAIIPIGQTQINALVRFLKKHITPSVLRNKEFFRKHADSIYIVSGGFKEWILPVVSAFGIKPSHVFANEFVRNDKGEIVGFDRENPLSSQRGKVKIMKKLGLVGRVAVIGDGFTDYQIKEEGLCELFFAFTENVKRMAVVEQADGILPSFDEFLYLFDLRPRALFYPKSRIKVLVLEHVHEQAVKRFRDEGYQVEIIPKAMSERELVLKITDVSILCIRSKTQVTERVLKRADKLMAVGAFCVGTNNIDLQACLLRGVAVFNAPYSNTRSVAELVIGLSIMLSRNIFDKAWALHRGRWEKDSRGSTEIRGKRMGIIGYGNIGSQVSVLAESLGMHVSFYDIAEKLPLGGAVQRRSMNELLAESDIVTVHVDGRKENQQLIGEREFQTMKAGAIFLNLSRGFVVDARALAKSIQGGEIRGAALDVHPEEPKSSAARFSSPLRGLPNVILTPHIGGNTQEAQERIGAFVSLALTAFVNTGSTQMSANFPQVQLSQQNGAHRLIHLHRNEPGVLAKINGIMKDYHLNIEGQYLKTNEHVGYVITDINKKYEKEVISQLRTIPSTIKLRMLF